MTSYSNTNLVANCLNILKKDNSCFLFLISGLLVKNEWDCEMIVIGLNKYKQQLQQQL